MSTTPPEVQGPARKPSFFSTEGEPVHGVTARSVLVGLALTALIAFVTPYSDLLIRGTWMACSHLPMAPLLMFMFMITVVNTFLHRAFPRAALTHAELMTIYVVMLVGALLPSFGLAAYLIPTIAGVGAVVTLLLSYMRVRFSWWPFHPLGYAMGPSWPMIQLWFSILVGWLTKVLILRYGGMRGFVRARPFFLGLVLGEFTVAGLWLLIDALTGVKDHRIFLT